jgi:hypothetical protein
MEREQGTPLESEGHKNFTTYSGQLGLNLDEYFLTTLRDHVLSSSSKMSLRPAKRTNFPGMKFEHLQKYVGK